MAYLMLRGQKFLQGDNTGQEKGDLSDQKSFAGDKGDRAEGDRNQGGSLHFQHDQKRKENFTRFLHCNRILCIKIMSGKPKIVKYTGTYSFVTN